MIVGVNHVQVNVPSADLERARDFYIGFMGMKEIAFAKGFIDAKQLKKMGDEASKSEYGQYLLRVLRDAEA